MKKTLLIVSVIASGFAFGQKKLVSIAYHSYDETGSLIYADSTANVYNSWQGGINEFKPSFKFNYGLFEFVSPDEDNNFIVHCDLMDHYSGLTFPLGFDYTTTNTLTNGKVTTADIGSGFRVLYNYNAQGKTTAKVWQSFDGMNWNSQDSTAFQYDPMGNLTVKQEFTIQIGAMVTSVDSMFYNAGTNLLNQSISYYYDSNAGSLVAAEKSLISYTGTKIQHIDYYVNFGSDLEWYLRVNYNYSGNNPTGLVAYTVINNIPTSLVFATGTFNSNAQNQHTEYSLVMQGDTLFKYTYEYDADGFMTKKNQYEPDSNNDLFLGQQTRYQFQNTLGIDELAVVTAKVYPNPSTTSVSIESDSPIKKIYVYNTAGQMVMEQSSGELNVVHLQPGTYILKGTTEKGNFTERLVKI